MLPLKTFATFALALMLLTGPGLAEPTEIVIRVLSKDAKFVGTSMGSARIVLRDADTGEMLATGLTEGSTGDTEKIMGTPRQRGVAISTEGSAKFATTLDLDRPRLIEATAFGPLAQRQSAVTVSAEQWVVPGKHINGGDGWVLEMPGLVVDVLDPPTHIRFEGRPEVTLKANVTTMCGCPLDPGGLWDADKYEVAAILSRNGKKERTVPLAFAGKTSQFAAMLELAEAGLYEATIYAYDPANGNTGIDRVTFFVE